MHRAVAMAVVVTGAVLATGVVVAQSAPPGVISSIKPTKDLDEGIKGNFVRGGVYRLSNAPLTVLLQTVYGVDEHRIVGGPEWIRHDRWDIEAKADAPSGASAPRSPDLRALLRDRFKLDAQMEKRDRPVYLLRIARSDGQLGPNLARSSFECPRDLEQVKALRESGRKGSHGEMPCGTLSQRDTLSFAGEPLANFVAFLWVDRVVQDGTGLTGPVDLTLKWTFTGDPVADQAAMLSAMREQLGLRLEPATAPLDVLVIKSVSRPDPN